MTEMAIDMVPPWEKYPTYEKYTIGWRMGAGEDYIHSWYRFVSKLPEAYDTRFAYLKRHRPAPVNWSDRVLDVLYPNEGYDDYESEISNKDQNKLIQLGLIEQDAAYNSWISQQVQIAWPWHTFDTPQDAARYSTRDFWFFSRQLKAAREKGKVAFERIPDNWKSVEKQLMSGDIGTVNPAKGLIALAQMLCVGTIESPWKLGLTLNDFQDSYEIDMGFVDAFRLWCTCAFDDDALLWEMFPKKEIPGAWLDWFEEEVLLDVQVFNLLEI